MFVILCVCECVVYCLVDVCVFLWIGCVCLLMFVNFVDIIPDFVDVVDVLWVFVLRSWILCLFPEVVCFCFCLRFVFLLMFVDCLWVLVFIYIYIYIHTYIYMYIIIFRGEGVVGG